jgi:hypothetical protein
VLLTLKIYDSSGILLRTINLGSAPASLAVVEWSPKPFNPEQGPMLLKDGAWSAVYDGKGAAGSNLQNGVYLFVIEQSSGAASVKFQVTVVGSGGSGVALTAAPNPAGSMAGQVEIRWSPAGQVVEMKVYGVAGDLVRDLGETAPPAVWNLDDGSGRPVPAGMYFISARIPHQRDPSFFKLAVRR